MPEKTIYSGHYTLQEQVASGGFAVIYRAVEKGRREPVAIKLANDANDPATGKSLREEAKILNRLDHRNIVKPFPIPRAGKLNNLDLARATELPGSPYFFVMEYLSGGTLEDYLRAVKVISVPEAAAITVQIARAADHMHQRAYAHNDLKLENVVFRYAVEVGKPFWPVLVDFGIAARIEAPKAASLYICPPERLSALNLAKAPETVPQELDLTKVDVWGLGIILYRMLGGLLPFSGSERSITRQIMTARPISLLKHNRSLPEQVDEVVIDGCLAKKPEERVTILELGRFLSPYAEGGEAKQAPPKKKGFVRRLFGARSVAN